MYSHETKVRVRYAETDQMGYVYYGNYATYYEVARVEAFRQLGFAYRELEAMGIGMPVLELKSSYLAPAKYDDLLTVKVIIPTMPGARICFSYEILNENGVLLNKGETTLVFIQLATGKPGRLPESLNNLLQPYFK